MKSVDPYLNTVIEEFHEFTENEVNERLAQSAVAFESWKRTGFDLRKSLMIKVSRLLRQKSNEYARAITAEMGKPLSESIAEVEKCAWVCEYYAENAEEFMKSETVETDADESYISFEPLGSILGVMPWNFPFWQVFRFAVPTLMAGNVVLLKHSSNVQISARNIENIFNEAGFPAGVFLNLVIGSAKVKAVIENDVIKAVSLTGSEFAGQMVAETTGHNIKKSVLELGGNNAFIVLEDADINKAVEIGVKSRMQNAGQSCIAAKRFIVLEKVSEQFIVSFKEAISRLVSGDPMDSMTSIGPLSGVQQAEEVERQVNISLGMGAILIAGGKRKNAFYEPSILVNVKPGMPVFDEEVFGPVAPVIIAKDIDEAISLANNSRFGLGVSLFTSDIKRAIVMAGEFGDGAVFINALVKSDPRLPFGGTKMSGFGRELAQQGIREFVNVKTVYIKRFENN